ncbi:hypothetical protein L1887_07382 [Cichorium endivia]|nr:hypothetical protein L1887_07382 [Cichorium endivia]
MQIIIATPGRLLDHIENKSGFSARLMGLKMLILDEADHLLDLGQKLKSFVAKARDVGVNSIVLFPKVPDALKTPTGDEACYDSGLVPRTIRLLKDKYPDLIIYIDVALDPYSSGGHDGIVREDAIEGRSDVSSVPFETTMQFLASELEEFLQE